ncbi:hypothetical protein FPHYL_3018 [Fusarium phyllophilum]|uniref:DUF7918 domain-containing protein n=1 Tax=Fusarium phyllophilum TaxID=47803 RepID=A0A8H5NKY4_9HYPO|nr:hypothetical protein FPHYL_3018 [Fusarium phyllophilum]
MAILPAVPAFSTTVVVSGEPADEYQPPRIIIPYDAEFKAVPRARCFIAAETGQSYSIRFRVSPLFRFSNNTDTLVVSIYINGNLVKESLVFETLLSKQDFIKSVSHLHRVYSDGSRSAATFVFEDLTPAESTNAATLQADMQVIRSLRTIRVILRSARRLSPDPMHCPNDQEVTFNNLQPSRLQTSHKALALNRHSQTHRTGPVNAPVHFQYYDVSVREAIRCFNFMYLSPDTLEAQGINHPNYINQAAQGMPQVIEPAPEPPRYAVRTMSDECVEIDLTGDNK